MTLIRVSASEATVLPLASIPDAPSLQGNMLSRHLEPKIVGFSPNSRYVGALGGHCGAVWSTESGEYVQSFDCGSFEQHWSLNHPNSRNSKSKLFRYPFDAEINSDASHYFSLSTRPIMGKWTDAEKPEYRVTVSHEDFADAVFVHLLSIWPGLFDVLRFWGNLLVMRGPGLATKGDKNLFWIPNSVRKGMGELSWHHTLDLVEHKGTSVLLRRMDGKVLVVDISGD
jgi:hypothetical protein